MHFDTNIIIAQIYIDGIVFGSTSPSKVQEFVNQMREEFEMNMVSELNFFLGRWNKLKVRFLPHNLNMQRTLWKGSALKKQSISNPNEHYFEAMKRWKWGKCWSNIIWEHDR